MKVASLIVKDAIGTLSHDERNGPIGAYISYLQKALKDHDEAVLKLEENCLTDLEQWMMAEISWRPCDEGMKDQIMAKMKHQREAVPTEMDIQVKEVPVTLRVDNWEYVMQLLAQSGADVDFLEKIRRQL